jgi:coenzyme F420-0:L-glutamate ligase/coenzyme F420-1:gamma-L-glutamate ligase
MTTRAAPVTYTPLLGFPEVVEGDDVAEITLRALQLNEIQLMNGDILVVSSKVVSKALGLQAPASNQADAVLSQTVRIVAERMTPAGVTRIVQCAAGPVMTAAGVDASNTADESILLLLPKDPDATAAQIRDGLQAGWLALSGSMVSTGVIVSDTAGRPWRNGQTDFALGACGIHVMDDLRGSRDADGRVLSVTERCVGDEIAAAADLVKGKSDGIPVAHVRGLGQYVRDAESTSGARSLVRTGPQDWFAYGMVEAVRAALGVQPGSAAASEVGIPFLAPEPVATRARRALRVALLTCPTAFGELGADTLLLMAPDNFTLGVVATRAEVALRGEGLSAALTRSPSPTPTVAGPLTSQPSALIVFQ